MNVKDQVAVVTGGGGGIGEGICLCLAKEGAHVVVSDINMELAEAVSAKVKKIGRKAVAVKTDVRFEEQCQALIQRTIDEMGRLDILVCSAGTAAAHLMNASQDGMNVENIPVEAWDLTMDVNLKGVFLCSRAAISHFKKQKKGKIINISSDAGRRGGTLLPAYSASKAGVINLSQSLALQLAPYNINVNSICPELIWTPLWEDGIKRMIEIRPEFKGAPPEDAFKSMVETQTPLRRAQTPEDMGNLVCFLASDLARKITGQAINLDGGAQLN